MLRITQYMRLLAGGAPPRARSSTAGAPVVIWNLARRCNLRCLHCYSASADHEFPGELSTAEVLEVMEDLYAFGVRALILSGGEPLLREGIFDISRRARARGFFVALSTNGTLIDEPAADAIRDVGYGYVGISIDGMRDAHDRFRSGAGCFDRALAGVRRCRAREVEVGLRFTLTADNAADLPALLRLADDEGAQKLYVSHLNYAGRGNVNRRRDTAHRRTREAMDLLFDACLERIERGSPLELVTGNNDADGAYLLLWAARRFPARVEPLRRLLEAWGGNSSGVGVANIDNLGHVHPDTMWGHHDLGSVRERPFSRIWTDLSDPVLAGLRARPRPVGGRCGRCTFLGICNGNTRVRAYRTRGDCWAEDPGCYLDDDEIGVAGAVAPGALAGPA